MNENAVTEQQVQSLIVETHTHVFTPMYQGVDQYHFPKTTVTVVLASRSDGLIGAGYSACIYPEDFNPGKGFDIALSEAQAMPWGIPPEQTVVVACHVLENGFSVVGFGVASGESIKSIQAAEIIAKRNAENEIWFGEGYRRAHRNWAEAIEEEE